MDLSHCEVFVQALVLCFTVRVLFFSTASWPEWEANEREEGETLVWFCFLFFSPKSSKPSKNKNTAAERIPGLQKHNAAPMLRSHSRLKDVALCWGDGCSFTEIPIARLGVNQPPVFQHLVQLLRRSAKPVLNTHSLSNPLNSFVNAQIVSIPSKVQ